MSEKVKNISDEDKEHLRKLGVPEVIIDELVEPNEKQRTFLTKLFEREEGKRGRPLPELAEERIDLSYLIIRHPDPQKRCSNFNCTNLSLPEIDFSGSVFGVSLIDTPTWLHSTSFDRTIFNGRAIFYKTVFLAGAGFVEARFTGNAVFNRTLFSAEANFTRSKFYKLASFNEISFRKETFFIKSVFKSTNDFYHTLFENTAYFTEAIFENAFSCSHVTFIGGAEFSMVHFNGTVAFNQVHWGALPSFKNTKFQQKPSSEYMDGILDLLNGQITARKLKLFSLLSRLKDVNQRSLSILKDLFLEKNITDHDLRQMKYWAESKKNYVHQSELLSTLTERNLSNINNLIEKEGVTAHPHHDAIEKPEYETIPLSEKVWKEDTEAPDKIRFFRLLCNEAGDHYREHKYFSFEMKAHSHHRETGFILRSFYWLYGEISGYGYSLIRPFIVWLYCSFYGWALFMASGVEETCRKSINLWDTLPFYLANLLPFFGSSYTARKSLECTNGIHPITFEGHMITLANSGISMLCIFLLFLALRNRFRL